MSVQVSDTELTKVKAQLIQKNADKLKFSA